MIDWRDEAACRGAPMEWFFPEHCDTNENAINLCFKCPVLEDCREYGIKHEEWGIYGGMTASERKAMRKKYGHRIEIITNGQKPPPHNGCGTSSGMTSLYRYYEKHPNEIRIKCTFCSEARSEYNRTIILEEEAKIKRRDRDRERKRLKKESLKVEENT